MERLNFSTNWNHKLGCDVFSTIRRFNPAVHFPGKKVEVFESNSKKTKGTAVYVSVTLFYLHQLKESAALLDTGYGLTETRAILEKMYKSKNINVKTEPFAYIILKKIKEKPVMEKLF